MAHEIQQFDNVMLFRQPAWHRLGTVVEDAVSPREALTIAGLDWTVDQCPITATLPDGREVPIRSHVANIRSDVNTQLGIVGAGWTPFQNEALADFCTALAEQDDRVVVETAGSIRNGAKVWFLLRGESFSVRDSDEVKPYILVSNGFDGLTALRCTPTTVRVVCSNTLHMVIPQQESAGRLRVKEACYSVKHTGNLMDRVGEAKAALKLYGRALDANRELIDELAAKDMGSEKVKRFLLECFTRDFGAIAETPTTKKEQNARDRAMEAVRMGHQRFESEAQVAGTSAWNAVNAYTGWLQHDRKQRGFFASPAQLEAKISSQLFGTNANRSIETFTLALAS